MPGSPPPSYGGVFGYLARDQFDTYVDLDKVMDVVSDEWNYYLDSKVLTFPRNPKRIPESQYQEGEYYLKPADSPCK